jgi:hypothetical protein
MIIRTVITACIIVLLLSMITAILRLRLRGYNALSGICDRSGALSEEFDNSVILMLTVSSAPSGSRWDWCCRQLPRLVGLGLPSRHCWAKRFAGRQIQPPRLHPPACATG